MEPQLNRTAVGLTRQSMPQLLPLGARIDPRVKPTAVRFSFSLQLYEGAEDTCTTDGPPWPDLFRPPASLNAAQPTAGTAWMATDQVRGLKAHGPSPAKGSSGCIERATNNRFRSTGQPWVKPGHGEEEDSRFPRSARARSSPSSTAVSSDSTAPSVPSRTPSE